MFIHRLISIFILLSLFFSVSLQAQTAQEYYNQGIELKKQNQIDEAIEAFQKAVEKDRKFAEAYYELALAYQLKKTPAALKRAEDAILEAKKYGDDDVKYLSALALIYEDRLMFPEAKYTLERVLEIEPENIEALGGISRIHAEEAKNMRNRVSYDLNTTFNILGIEEWMRSGEKKEFAQLIIDEYLDYCMVYPLLWDKNMLKYFNSSSGLYIVPPALEMIKILIGELSWDEFVTYEDSIARAYNNNILEIDPDNRDALYRQGLVYFDSDSLKEFAKLFEKLTEKYTDDKDGHLFLGLAYHRLNDYDKAHKQYETAKGLMSNDERAVFSNVGYLKVGGLKETEIRTSESDTSKFWYQRDPLFLTPYSERQLEHYSRVAEANLRFSIPREDIEGWQTDRGKIFIKYGASEKRKIFANNDAFDIGTVKSFKKFYYIMFKRDLNIDFYVDYNKHDYWYYPDFTFMFETGFGDEKNNYKLGTSMSGLNFQEIAEEVETEFPEYYKYEPKGLFIDFPFDVATFRGEKGRTRMEVYYGVPFNKVRFEEEGEYYYGNYEVGLFLHDRNWKRALEDVQDKDLQFEVTAIDTSSDSFTVDQLINHVAPDSYYFAVEMRDLYSDNIGTYRDTLELKEYGYGSLKISDIQLASNIKMLDSLGAVIRENLIIIPNPPRFYRANQPIYIYYEIYNLFMDAFPGNTDYTVEYSIQYIGEEKYSVVDYIRRLIVNEKQELGVTTIFTRHGIDRDECSFLCLDHNLTKPGPYQLTLKVTDNIAQKTVEKSVLLRLFENR
ncbi:hypothetical protein AMJ80_02870 [bacterium SM23_31]|nr:MAG: hypothetical protein AMJ80_02870 [bacterium SM23_31]